jgi:PAS domain S-box-containing protein
MNLVYTPFIIPMSAAVVVCLLVLLYAIRHRNIASSPAFILLMGAIIEWLVCYLLWMITDDVQLKVLLSKIEYIGVVTVAPAWLLFAVQYAGHNKWISANNIALIFILPIVTLILVWTNEQHWLIWDGYRFHWEHDILLPDIKYGQWFWVQTAYSYLLLILGTLLILRRVFESSQYYRNQAIVLVAGVLVPWFGNILYVLQIGFIPGLDPTPFFFAISSVLLGAGLFYFRLLSIVPIARNLVVENMDGCLLVLDGNNRIVDLNRACLNIFGWSLKKVVGKNITEVWTYNKELLEKYSEALNVRSEITLEKNGEIYYYDLQIQPLYNRNNSYMGRLITLHDITELREAQMELQRQRKQESIELIAGGVAHDFNNLLSIIMGNLKLVKVACEEHRDIKEYLQRIHDSAQKASAITSQLLTFTKGIEPDREPLSLSRIVQDTAELILSTSEVSYQLKIPPDLWQVYADKNLMIQVLENLIVNANQAMPEGGTIFITAENIKPSPLLPKPLKMIGAYVKLSFKDQGIGIPREQLNKIFDPYFTTKLQGSGLGLAICDTIIRKHDGYIAVESVVGKGSTFMVYLPAYQEQLKN